MPNRYQTNFEVGQDNVRKWGMDLHHPVFGSTAALALLFVMGTLIAPHLSRVIFDGAKKWSINHFDWLFLLSANIFVLLCLVLLVVPFGAIRIGGKDARPDFSTISWFAMLFAAGMGIGLMFWSVAEPTGYFTDWFGTPLGVAPRTPAAADLALGATMFHWGLHPWAIYGVVGLSLAFFRFNKGLPLTIRSGFFPLIGDRSWGLPGHVIDIVAALATIFGLATSLGFGARQAASGLHFLFGIDNGLPTQILIIIGVTMVAVISVVRGLDGGVKLLSNINLAIAVALLAFVMIAGPTLAILTAIWTAASSYIEHIIPFSSWSERTDDKFLHGWTVFYWAWWISWSPFVGMFIARISRGRTVREFILAVLLVPTLVTLVWMATFGGSALYQVENNIGALSAGLGDISLALFQMLTNLPLPQISSSIAIILVLLFFVTSSDSGSLVVDSITAGGKLDAPIPQRIYWAFMEGIIAGALLFGGGKDALGALQAAAISVGLPFTIVLLVLCVGLFMGLAHEWRFVQGPSAIEEPNEASHQL